jgi:signal peptidase I
VIASAERRIFHGARPARAVEDALASIGPPRAVRKLLLRCERGGPVPLRMRGRSPRVPFAFTAAVAAIVLVRLFLVGAYAVEWNSMEPALAPRSEGGDALVLVNLRAFAASPPARGDIVVFQAPGGDALYVKRAMGLPGESVSLGGGDLFVGGARLVKERALLDRVRVPLFRESDFRREGNRREQPEPLHTGLPDASGRVERGAPCVEAVVRARVRAAAQPCTIALHLDEGLLGGRATRSLVLRTVGPGAGAFSGGAEVASGPEFLLRPGAWREVWITNADRVFRVELDGREVARAALPVYGPSVRVAVEVEGNGEVEALEVARDALYGQPDDAPGRTWDLSAEEVFVLGDNSAKSRDSRHFGPIRLSALRGRPFLVAWPLPRVRTLQ